MKSGKAVLILGIISMILGVISRITMIPLPPVNLEANALLMFANSCFLLSIAFSLIEKK